MNTLLLIAAAMAVQPSDSLSVNLTQVEVTANRATVRTPVAYTNVSAKELAKINDGRDIPFLLEGTPSVVTTGDAGSGVGYSYIRIRGVDATRINVTANGVPLNDPESHSVYWVNTPDLTSSLRDVQVQRGAGTSANGAGAFGASVNMVTGAPSIDPYANVTAGYGSYNTNRQTVKVGSGLFADHWSVDARFSHIGSDGYLDRAWSKLWSYQGQLAYSSYFTNISLLAFGGNEKTYQAWNYPTAEEMQKYGRRYNSCGEYTDSDGNTAYYPDQIDNFTQHHVHLNLSQYLGHDIRLSLTGFYIRGLGYYDQYKTNQKLKNYGLTSDLGARSDLTRLKYNDNNYGGANLNLNWTGSRVKTALGTSISWFTGSHYGQVQWVREFQGAINPLQEYYRNMGRKFDATVFGRADWTISSPLTAYADLQYRHIRYSIRGINDDLAPLDILQNYNFFNPKVGLTYINGAHRAFASWSVAQKEPVRDNFTEANPGQYPSAEKLYDYELGYTFGHRLFSVGVNLYYMDYKDQLVLTGQISDTGNALSVNVPRSYRMGIELQGALKPCSWFDWTINATLSRNRIKNFTEYVFDWENYRYVTQYCGDSPISFSPSVIAHNAFNFNYKSASASLVTRYVSEQYMDNARSASARLDAYCVSDLHLGYDFTTIPGMKDLRLGVVIYNIFNKKYCNNGWASAEYADGHIVRYAGFAAQATANVMATVSMTF